MSAKNMRSRPLPKIAAALLSVVTGVHFALAVEAETKPPNQMQSGVAAFRVRTDFGTQLHQCWSAPVAAKTYRGKFPLLQLTLNRDGSLSSEPVLLNSSDEPLFYGGSRYVRGSLYSLAQRRCEKLAWTPALNVLRRLRATSGV